MTLDSTKVRVAVTGTVSVAATGSTAPTDASTALAVAFKDLGYVGEDGVSETRDRSSNDIKAWQNGDTVRTVITDGKLTYKLTLIETKKETVELFYGTTVTQTVTDGSYVVVPTSTGGRQAFVFDVVDGANLKRIYVPQGEVTDVGDVTYANGEPIGYEVTITAYSDSTLGGSAKVWETALKS